MNLESLIGPSLLFFLGAGAFLFGWLIRAMLDHPPRQGRYVRLCPIHGLFTLHRQFKGESSCCPICGAHTKLMPIQRYKPPKD